MLLERCCRFCATLHQVQPTAVTECAWYTAPWPCPRKITWLSRSALEFVWLLGTGSANPRSDLFIHSRENATCTRWGSCDAIQIHDLATKYALWKTAKRSR